MSISEDQLIDTIEMRLGYSLDHSQQEAIKHGSGPLLIAAGPGTGKTEVLVSRTLKLLCCDGVAPASILLTTFTDKAAQNLLDRVTDSFQFLKTQHPTLASIDPSELRVGTLHGICNDVMQKYRYTAYQNLRLLDEVESALLIHRKVVTPTQLLRPALLTQFRYLFGNKPTQYLNKWDWSLCLGILFCRIVEDRIDRTALTQSGGAWAALEQVFQQYEQALADAHCCDFSTLLRHFREFLDSGQGALFLNGDGSDIRVPLLHVLVDEYQDTNPIQEDIYLRMVAQSPHNITVVGDDDQALYRFRGGTVECMVGFASACQTRFGVHPNVVYLRDCHRSHPDIVNWCNNYITSFPQMQSPNARIAGKPPLTAAVVASGTHPAISHIRAGTLAQCAQAVANLVVQLRTNGVIADYSQCVLLLRSAKNSPNNAGKYIAAFEAAGVPVYNPRSKDFLEQDEVKQCLGGFIRIVDRDLTEANALMSGEVKDMILDWVNEYNSIATTNHELADYVAKAGQAIAGQGINMRLSPATPTLLYRILSHEPFTTYQLNPAQDLRLSKLTRMFEAFGNGN